MQTSSKRFFSIVWMMLAMAGAAAAQVPFTMLFTQGAISTPVPNDSVLTLTAPLGQSQTLLVRATYTGTGSVTVTQQPLLTGAPTFSATYNQSLPFTLTTNQSFVVAVRFAPNSAAVDAARMVLPFAETPATSVGAISLSLQGLTSAFVVSYVLPADNNVVPLANGGTIPFPETLVSGTSQAALNLTNIGSAIGQVTRITVTGAAFRLQGLPLFPSNVPGGQNLQVQVLFRPTAIGVSTGSVTVETVGGDPVTVTLRGSAVAPLLTYQAGTPPVSVNAGGTITLPSADTGQSSTTVVRISNTGSGAATVSSLSIIGVGYAIANAPTLPQTLAPNTSVSFIVTFSPTRVGVQTGTLVVNSDTFNLTGSGLGPALTFSYTAGGTVFPLGGTTNAMIFSPVRVTESAQLGLDIRNTSASPVTILNTGVQTAGAFSVVNPPPLPAVIAPNGTLRINVKFEPTAPGFTTSTLIVDTNSFPLSGSGTAPPSLPSYAITGPSGTVLPLTQPSVGLRLATPYPVALTGVLTLAPVSGALPSDPAAQFATGGRTVNFRIPANATDAIFGAQGTQVGLQVGTVAGSQTLTPTFATLAGGLDLTPTTPTSSQFSIAAAAPTLISAQVTNATATGLTVEVTGYTTSRTLTVANVQFTAASGFKMPTTQFAVDAKSVATAWFQGTASQAFGGQFRMSIPFTFQVPAAQIPTGGTILTGISQVTISVANESGTSTVLQARAR